MFEYGCERKTMICVRSVGICAGISLGMNETDPTNPAKIPSKVVGKMSA